MQKHILRFVLTAIIYIAIKAAVSLFGFEYVVTFLLACVTADVFIIKEKKEKEKENEHEQP